MSMTRTTFFVLRAASERLVFKVGYRRGHWSRESLERLAARQGMELVDAYSIARDSKGWIEASRRSIPIQETIMTTTSRPLTPSERVSRSRRRALEAGARRVEIIIRDPAAIAALDDGIRLNGSTIAAISAALRMAFPVAKDNQDL